MQQSSGCQRVSIRKLHLTGWCNFFLPFEGNVLYCRFLKIASENQLLKSKPLYEIRAIEFSRCLSNMTSNVDSEFRTRYGKFFIALTKIGHFRKSALCIARPSHLKYNDVTFEYAVATCLQYTRILSNCTVRYIILLKSSKIGIRGLPMLFWYTYWILRFEKLFIPVPGIYYKFHRESIAFVTSISSYQIFYTRPI